MMNYIDMNSMSQGYYIIKDASMTYKQDLSVDGHQTMNNGIGHSMMCPYTYYCGFGQVKNLPLRINWNWQDVGSLFLRILDLGRFRTCPYISISNF
jgi:hypothetical protein